MSNIKNIIFDLGGVNRWYGIHNNDGLHVGAHQNHSA